MISVCMATYNGADYIKEQLDSILYNLSKEDEIIISDDGSKDDTLKIIDEYIRENSNIILINGPKKGVIKNFENAINHSKGDIIFLSDQDDVWEKNKVEVVKKQFENEKTLVVLHDATIIDGNGLQTGNSFYALRNSKTGIVKNMIKNSYIGCCMAFRATMKDVILPIPENVDMHDSWIGMLSEFEKGSVVIPEKLIRYRRHEKNVSGMKHYTFSKMIKKRIVLTKELKKRRRLKGGQL